MSSSPKSRVRSMRERQAAAARRRQLVVTGVVVALVLAAVVILALALRASSGSDGERAATPSNVRNGAVVVGAASAPVHVEVFEDFQCPGCRVFEEGAAPVLAEVTKAGTARVSYYVLSFLGPESVRAGNAAACAADVSPARFVALHDYLYAHQPTENSGGYREADLVAAGRAVGLGADYAGCVRDGTYREWVRDVNREHAPRVRQTPTVFIDGRELPRESYGPQQLRAAIQAAAR